MEQVNRVELRGIVGSVRESVVGDQIVTRLTVATNLAYKGRNGEAIIETTWHNVTTWSAQPLGIKKGASVEVIGRIRNQRYTNINGEEASYIDILAKKVTELDTRPEFELE